jgi:Cu-Zn family superoxide dismutase
LFTLPEEYRVMRDWHLLCFLLLMAVVACQAPDTGQEAPKPAAAVEPEPARRIVAVADLAPKSGSELSGLAVLTETGGEVEFDVRIERVEPGLHAVHIHETGDCSAEDATSAGGHWNPTGVEHGRWGEPPYHLGDIGNIEVGEDGKGALTLRTDRWSIGGSPDHDVVGKAVVVHAGADDFTSQPSGAAGERIGCGVIEMETQGGEM